jgi:hypothetical protein
MNVTRAAFYPNVASPALVVSRTQIERSPLRLTSTSADAEEAPTTLPMGLEWAQLAVNHAR